MSKAQAISDDDVIADPIRDDDVEVSAIHPDDVIPDPPKPREPNSFPESVGKAAYRSRLFGLSEPVMGYLNTLKPSYGPIVTPSGIPPMGVPAVGDERKQLMAQGSADEKTRQDNARADHPAGYFLGTVLGAGSLPLPGAAAPIVSGGLMGAGYSDADLGKGEYGKMALDTGIAVAGGALSHRLFGGGTGAAAEVSANESAVRAATGTGNIAGQNKMMKMPTRGGNIDDFMENTQVAGDRIRNEPGVLGWFDGIRDIVPRLQIAAKKYGAQIGEIGKKVDQTPDAVSGTNIMQRILDEAAAIPPNENGKAVQDYLLREAENFQKKPRMSFSEAQDFKNNTKFTSPAAQTSVTTASGAENMVKAIIGQEMERAADSAGVGAEYKAAKEGYDTFINASQKGSQRVQQLQNNNRLSLPEHIAGAGSAAAGLGAGIIGGHSVGSAIAGAVGGAVAGYGISAVTKMARNYGDALASKTAGLVAEALTASPGSVYDRLLNEAAQRGGAAFVAMHETLMKRDPNYASLINAVTPSNLTPGSER